jgi:hypothetical protein
MNFMIAVGHGYSGQGKVRGQDWNPPAVYRCAPAGIVDLTHHENRFRGALNPEIVSVSSRLLDRDISSLGDGVAASLYPKFGTRPNAPLHPR